VSNDTKDLTKRQINIKVEPDLFTKIKVKAAEKDITIQDLGIKLFTEWLDKHDKR
jgi:hypothetical protein